MNSDKVKVGKKTGYPVYSPDYEYGGRRPRQLGEKETLTDIFKEMCDVMRLIPDTDETLQKTVADKLRSHIDRAEMTAEQREKSEHRLLLATEDTHSSLLRAKHGDLVFPEIVKCCRVFGKVDQLGMDEGIKAAIDRIKSHAESNAKECAVGAVREVPPSMYDIEYEDAAGNKQTERVLTTGVYILTEQEMVLLEETIRAAIEERVALSVTER